jgi:hypothetical protein
MSLRKVIVTVLLVAVAALLVFWGLKTRPGVETTPPVETAGKQDPLQHPLLAHMKEAEKIDIGDSTEHDLAIIGQGNEIRVAISPRLLEKLGPGALERMGMLGPDETMSWNRYNRFIEKLHERIAELDPHAHEESEEGHSHEHDNAPAEPAGAGNH